MINTNIFGMEEKALKLCENRASLIANNIANSATPGYKARDIDFHQALKNANNGQTTLEKSNSAHLQSANNNDGQTIFYRIPMQSSFDENTVDDEIERKNFVENSINYQANLSFAQNKMSTLMKALRGE